jgi:trimeric autotransporter adhesin
LVDDVADVVTEAAGQGTDLVQSAVTYTLSANVENLTLTIGLTINGTGNTLDNILTGNYVANTLTGGAGNDTLDGGSGADTLIGGTGNDTYIVDTGTDIVTELAAEGTDLVKSAATFTLSANVENLLLTGTSNNNGTGNALANILTGNTGNNILNGDAGADTLIGGAGNDTYVVDNAGDVVTELANEGTDIVQSSISYTLGTNVENLTLTGTAAINAIGNAVGNILTGNAGDNVINGGLGADTMNGGAGNDSYVVDNVGDVITENWNAGTDSVQSSVTYTLSSNVENLTLLGTAANGTGNAVANILVGNASNNILDGGAGVDTMTGGAGNDTYVVDNTADVVTENLNEGTDLVQSTATYTLSANVENLTLTGTANVNATGNALVNILFGNIGNNILNGGEGADTMMGGAGNDTYVVDNASDVVTELANEGTDIVQSSISYTLGTNVENLTLTGTAAINATGNSVANIITGNAGDNAINGGAGADTMNGGAGNDSYVVDNVGDVITENWNSGTDSVQSSVSYTLAANVENLTLTGSAAINATGNTLANILFGNTGNNILDGGAAADSMTGGAGNDTYVVDSTGDVVTENLNEGTDLVQSAITYTLGSNLENLTLIGTANINATGNALANILFGNVANNILNGGEGADTMTGGAGNDTYVVDNASDIVTENTNEGSDLVQSSITYTLTNNVESLALTGTAAINGTGNALDNLIKGNAGINVLNGGAGNDILQGGAGADTLTDTAGNNLLDGGDGDDVITAGNGNDFIAGGKGNDTITTGTGADVIAFNRGDGVDTINASTTKDNTLSLGKGIKYSDLAFKKNANDLILVTGSGESITVKDWYVSTANHNINNLQILIEGTSDYDAASASKINNKKIEQFNFEGLVGKFDQARTANPTLTSWALSSSLMEFYVNSSDMAGIGGDLAYQYAKSGNFANVSLAPAATILGNAQFGKINQNLQAVASLQDLSPRLM